MSIDRHTISLKCGDCGQKGTADVADSDPPSRQRREIEGVSGGFNVKTYPLHSQQASAIFCDCGAVVLA